MSNYKVIYEGWHRHLDEARYDFKPGSPTNNVSREVNQVLKQRVMGWATEAAGEKRDPEDLIFYKRLSLAPADMKPQWLYFFKAGDSQMVPVPVGTEEFIDLHNSNALGMNTGGDDLGRPPSAFELELGNLWIQTLVGAVEKRLGKEIDIPIAVEAIPEFEFPDLGISDEEQLSQVDLSDFDLDTLGLEAPEPETAPVSPEMAPDVEPDEEPDEQDRVVAGINSDVYPDSLLNMLKPLDFLTKDEKGRLLLLMLKAVEEDNVVLEALGGPDREPRTFSPNTVRDLNDLLASFQLEPKAQQKLEKTLNKWAKLNTVKFSAPPKEPEMDFELPPEASEPVDGDPQPEDESEPVDGGPQPEDEESGIVDKAMDTVKQKAQDLGVEIPDVEQVKLALDAISFAGVTGAGEIIATPATIASLALNIATKDWDDALIDVVSLLPVAGKAFKLSAKTAKTAKAAKTLATAADISSRAGKIADVVKKGKAAKNVAKNLGAILGSRLDKGELQQVAKIRDFIAKLADSGVFGDAPSELSEPFLDMMTAANKAQRDKNNVRESLDRLQTLAGINKRIL